MFQIYIVPKIKHCNETRYYFYYLLNNKQKIHKLISLIFKQLIKNKMCFVNNNRFEKF